MYIQITNKCNMKCGHCGFSCNENGKNMSLRTFRKALEIAYEFVSIGGGEPTIHPKFWQFVCEALAVKEYVWLATNGKKTNAAITLAKMAKKGIIQCALSLDKYHEPIDQSVIHAFSEKENLGDDDHREIRESGNDPIQSGRCDNGKNDCICSSIFVTPDGKIYGCGCSDAPQLGTVFKPAIPEEYEIENCWKQQTWEK